jgi:hypothetical protein
MQTQINTKRVPVKAEKGRTARKPKRVRRPRRRTFWLTNDTPHLGFVCGEGVSATEAEDLKVWDIAAIEQTRDEPAAIGRVLAITADSVTIRRVKGDETYGLRGLSFLGRVNPEPVGKDDGLTDEQRATLKRLHDKLDRLGDEDDQIIRCSARYEIEKQIFDITHPADVDDWSKWEG